MKKYLLQKCFDDAEQEDIINSIKHKEWLEDKNLSGISIFGKESDIEKYLDNLNCEFKIVILKIPTEIQLERVSYLLKKLETKCDSDAEVFNLIDFSNNHFFTLLGVAKSLFDTTGFRFSKEMPSPVEDSFKEKIFKIFKLKGIAGAEYRYQNKNNLTDSLSYLAWSHKLQRWKNKASDNPTLSSEIEEALALIEGKFKKHANTALEQFSKYNLGESNNE